VTLAASPSRRAGAVPSGGPPSAAWLRDLAEVGVGDAPLVGGKAYPLALLMRRGFTVPRGFCVTTEAFRQAGGLAAAGGRLPPALREAILSAWRAAGLSAAAVRSSASEEDGRASSWAGVFPTTLPVEDADELIAAVERCFRSVFAPETTLYRRAASDAPLPAMAVLVQELVDADAAGMVFTANPVTGARDEIVINVVAGLGSPLAAGRLTGDSFVVARDGTLKAERVAPKPFRLTRRGEVEVAAGERERPAITRQDAASLARKALEIEDSLGDPQDIEFALAEGRIHVLQARPIPRLPAPRDPRIGPGPARDDLARGEADLEDLLRRERRRLRRRIAALRRQGTITAREVVLSDGNVGELLPTPTPMSFGLFREIFAGRGGAIVRGRRALGYHVHDDSARALYELVCGHPYFNVEVDLSTFDIGVPRDADEVVGRVVESPSRANYPELGLYPQAWPDGGGGERGGAARRFHAAMLSAGRAALERFPTTIEPALRRAVAEARRPVGDPAGVATLVEAVLRRLDRLKHGSCVHFVVAARLGFFFAEMVRGRLARHLAAPELLPHLLQGLEGSRITQQALDLERVASGLLDRDAFLERYGHLAANELEISLPRFDEDPSALEVLLHDLKASGRRPAEELRRQRRRRLEAEAEVRRRLASTRAAAGEVDAFAADLRLAQAFLPLRETVKYHYAAEYAAIRALLLRLREALGWRADDVFHLRPEELPLCAAAPATLERRVAERRRARGFAMELARQGRMPAVVFGARLDELGARREAPDARRLAGSPIAPGVATGTVRRLDCGAGDAPVRSGCRGDEILVTRSANLGLAPLLRMVAGLVVEIGGVLAHAACQAREAGIPAVVLPDAARSLRDGMTVRLDGSRGLVEVLRDGVDP
jgi:pyruvate,water dikinase